MYSCARQIFKLLG